MLLGNYNLHKCIVDNVMLASILIINCVDIGPVATAKSIFQPQLSNNTIVVAVHVHIA